MQKKKKKKEERETINEIHNHKKPYILVSFKSS
jgi:hypothetical protein